MQKYQDRVFSTAGQPIQGVLVTVYNHGTSTLATLYSDNGVTVRDNPVSTDVDGLFYFYVADGRYDIGFSGSAIASPLLLTDVEIADITDGALTLNSVSTKSLNGILYADRYASLQAAHDALPSGGGEIHVPKGTYSKLTISKSNVKIIGSSGAVVTSAVVDDNVITINAGVSNVVIDGLTVIAGGKAIDESNFFLGNCIYVAGSRVAPCSEIVVRNCNLSGGMNCVYFNYTDRGSIENNVFTTTHVGLSQVELDGSNYNIVHGNTFKDSGGTANAVYVLTRGFYGFPSDPSNFNVICNNTVTGAYAFEAFNCFKGYNTFSDNTINLTSAVANSSGIVLQNPAAVTPGGVVGNTISGNVISISGVGGTGNSGVSITNGPTVLAPTDCIVTGNTVQFNLSAPSASYGVFLSRTVRCVVAENTITNTAGLITGIAISDNNSTDNQIRGNIIYAPSGQGVTFVGSGNKITANHIISPGSAGIFLAATASAGTNCLVAFNSVRNGADRGYSFTDNTATNIGFYGNVGTANALADFVPAGNTYIAYNAQSAALGGKISTYNGIATVGNGVPSEVATVDLTGQSAAIGSTTLYAVPASGAGLYKITYYAKVTRAATTSSTLGALTVGWTDVDDSVVQSNASATNTGNTTTSFLSSSFVVNAKASTNITYQTAYATSGATSMLYSLHVKVEAL